MGKKFLSALTLTIIWGATVLSSQEDDGMVSALTGDDLQARWDAYRALLEKGDAAVPELVPVLRTHSEVRELAAELLYRIHSPQALSAIVTALPGLMEDLASASAPERESAARALMRLREQAAGAVETLLGALEEAAHPWPLISALHVIDGQDERVRRAIADVVAQRFLPHVNLRHPAMAKVAAASQAGESLTALDCFRDALVGLIAGRRLTTEAAWLYGFTQADELLAEGVVRTSHYGAFHLRTRTEIGHPGLVFWHKLPAGGYSAGLRLLPKGLHWTVPLAGAYRDTGDPRYLEAWMAYYADFGRNWEWQHQRVVDDPRYHEAMEADGHPAASLQWPFQSILHPAWRLQVFLPWLAEVVSHDQAAARQHIDSLFLAETLLAFTEGDLLRGLEKVRGPITVPNQFVKLTASMLKAGVVLEPMRRAAEWRDSAVEGMLRYVENAGFLPDGGDLEQAFNYHVHLSRAVNGFLEAAEAFPPFARQTPDWVSHLIGVRNYRERFVAISNNYWRPLRDDPTALNLHVDTVYFPYSGYALLRDGPGAEAHQLYFKNSRPQSGHRWGMDSNSLQVNAFGRKLLVKSGLLNDPLSWYYTAPERLDPMRAYFVGSESQNTVLVDGLSQHIPRTGGATYQDVIPARFLASPQFDFIEGHFGADAAAGRHYGGHSIHGKIADIEPIGDVAHERSVIFVRELGLWIIEDRLQSIREHTFTQTWNLHPDFDPSTISIDTKRGRIRAAMPSGEQLLWFQTGNVPQITYEVFHGLLDGERALGWVAIEQGPHVYTPAADIHASWRGSGPQHLISVLIPIETAQGLIPLVEVLTSAQQDFSGLRINFADGRRLDYLSAVDGRRSLSSNDIVFHANRLLVLRDGIATSGIVLDADLPDGRRDFAFEWDEVGSRTVIRQPLEVPSGFRWVEESSCFIPRYNRAESKL